MEPFRSPTSRPPALDDQLGKTKTLLRGEWRINLSHEDLRFPMCGCYPHRAGGLRYLKRSQRPEELHLGRALETGEAYGEPEDELLRRLYSLTNETDLERPLAELEADEKFMESRRLAAEVLDLLKDRALGTGRADLLDPL